MFHQYIGHSFRKLIWALLTFKVPFLAMTLKLVKVSYLYLLKYHDYMGSLCFSLLK